MPKYLIRAANFVAEISNDDELLHLANVGTVQKDTKLCELPGKTWIQAKDLSTLQNFWGVEDEITPDQNDKTKIANPNDEINDKNKKIIPIPNIMPPRLETVVDNFPSSVEDNGDNNDATQIAQAPTPPNDATQIAQDPTPQNDKPQQTNETASSECASKKEYQSIASDVLDAICDNGEILSVNALPNVTESALTFEVEKIKKISNVSWNVPKKQNQNTPEMAQNSETNMAESHQDEDHKSKRNKNTKRQRNKTKCESESAKAPQNTTRSNDHENDKNMDDSPALSPHHDSPVPGMNQETASTDHVHSNPNDDENTRLEATNATHNSDDPASTVQGDNLIPPTEDKLPPDSIQNINESPNQTHPHNPIDENISASQNTTQSPDNADKSRISIDIELDDIDSDICNETAHTENPLNSEQNQFSDADINFGQINPEDAAALYTFLYEEEEDEDPSDRTTVGPSPTFLKEPNSLVDNPDSLARLGEHANQADSIKPYSPQEKDKKQNGPAIQFADDYAPTKARYRIQPEKTQNSDNPENVTSEDADTRAWKSKHQAHVDDVLSYANTKDLSAELNAAVSAFEAAKAAANQSENSNPSHAQNVLNALEDEKTRAYDFSSAQRLSRLENLNHSDNDAQKETNIYNVPEDLLDENPSEIFKIRNRKDLLKQIEASAMQERAQMELESAPTMRKAPTRELMSKDSLAIIDEESHSDKLKIRGRSELRRMLEAEAKAAEMDSIQAMAIVATNDYSENNQGQLRSLFEEQDELHLYLANEIKKRESKVNLSALEPDDDDDDDDLSDSLADQYPKRNNNAVAVAPKPVAEPTMITGEVAKTCPAPTSIDDPFFKEKLVSGESPIASFDTLFLTTHRIWFIQGNKKRITAYESHDIENVQWVAQKEEKNLTYLLIDIAIIIALCTLYVLLPQHSLIFIVLLIFCICMLSVLYIICFKKTLQIGLPNGIVLKSNVAITSDNRHQAMEFLGLVESTRLERKRQIKG